MSLDEEFMCQCVSKFLDACAQQKIKDARLAKVVRLVVVFLLKFNFPKTPELAKAVLPLSVNLCRIFPLTQNSTPQD